MPSLEIIVCPEPRCGLPAEIMERFVLASTDGPVEHCKTSCVGGHVRTPLSSQVREVLVKEAARARGR
jgi:hypothetical protein